MPKSPRFPRVEDILPSKGFGHIFHPVVSLRTLCPGQIRLRDDGGWECDHCCARSRAGRKPPPIPASHRERVESPFWALTVSHQGRRKTISVRSRQYSHALELRRKLLREIWGGKLPWLSGTEPTLKDLLGLVESHYSVVGNRSTRALALRIKNILSYPDWCEGNIPATKVTATQVDAYRAWRRKWESGNSPAYINRELAILRQAWRIAMRRVDEQGRPLIDRMPVIEFFREPAPRRRYAHPGEAEALIAAIERRKRYDVADLVRFLAITGWRSSEPASLRWWDVNRFAKTITLRTNKTDEPREIPYGGTDLESIIDRRRSVTDRYEAVTKKTCEWVFHRHGRPIRRWERTWWRALADVGIDRKSARVLRPHDFRRTAARDTVAATGNPSVACALIGWKTTRMLARYGIVDVEDLRGALKSVKDLRQKQLESIEQVAVPMGLKPTTQK